MGKLWPWLMLLLVAGQVVELVLLRRMHVVCYCGVQ